MSPAAIQICRCLQAVGEDNMWENNKFSSPTGTGDLEFQPVNGSSSAAAEGVSMTFSPIVHVDSSMTLGMVVIAIICGLLCVFLRRFAYASAADASASAANRSSPSLGHPNRKWGLHPSAVAALPLVAYATAAEPRVNDDCSICLTEFEEGETVKLIPHCGHVFHATCIDTWLSTHVTCPLCRSAQLFEIADGVGGLSGCDAAAQV